MNIVIGFYDFLKDIWNNKRILWELSKNDFKAKYASSLLGTVWAFIQPLMTILVFWFVYEVGFRTPPMKDVPFIIWLLPAYLVWAYFSESLTAVTNSLLEYSYLVRKVNFRVSIIPLVKIISVSIVHIVFILFIFFMNALYKIPISIYNLQVIYYFVCTTILLIGLGWLLAAIAPFVTDTVNIVNVIIQIGFWATPIIWDPDNMSKVVQLILKINPMFYICRGYRDSFVDQIWFWERGYTNVYFWIIVTIVFIIGAITFKKLRPHFADVL